MFWQQKNNLQMTDVFLHICVVALKRYSTVTKRYKKDNSIEETLSLLSIRMAADLESKTRYVTEYTGRFVMQYIIQSFFASIKLF